MLTPEDMHLIERYLDDQLSPSRRAAFERRLRTEVELRGALDDEQALRAYLSPADDRADLLAKLDALMQAPPRPVRTPHTMVIGGLILLVALLFFLWWQYRPASTEVPQDLPVAVVPELPARPPALAQTPQSTLEALVARGGLDAEVEVLPAGESPDLPHVYTGGVVAFELTGTVKTAVPTEALELRALLYDNRPAAYTADTPLLSRPLALAPSAVRNTLRYALPLRVALPPGRYYVVIEDVTTGTPLRVHRLRVGE